MRNAHSLAGNRCILILTNVCLLLSLIVFIPLIFDNGIFVEKLFSIPDRQIPKHNPQYVGLSSDDTVHQCSSSIIKEYIRTHDFFPELGTWIINNNTPISWTPELCHFNASRMQKNILQCIKSKKFYSFLILGDSNGKRYADALFKLLSSGHNTDCNTIIREGGGSRSPDIKYIEKESRRDESDFRFHDGDCRGCKRLVRECLFDGVQITVETIGMIHVLDTNINITQNQNDCDPGEQCFQSNTYQEMIFREYLQWRQYPDVIMLFQSSHDRMRKTLAVFDASINYLVKLVENLVPQNTTVV